ncbi:MAG: glutaredoxin, partial [Actinobacteria bacterium]|nr:glutaredoxin [Actinomycetota bacterium]
MSDLATPIVYGAAWCGYCQALKAYLESLGVSYDYRDVDDKAIEKEM